ncbi:putative membrane protein [Forsythia ovata]|uniref:Membrane protein n=1 Tax=Forsythia ovata TaxID=205694 RepID=A0ABD1RZS6_9LAMI
MGICMIKNDQSGYVNGRSGQQRFAITVGSDIILSKVQKFEKQRCINFHIFKEKHMAYVDHAFSISDEDIMIESSYTVSNKPPIKETMSRFIFGALGIILGIAMAINKVGVDTAHNPVCARVGIVTTGKRKCRKCMPLFLNDGTTAVMCSDENHCDSENSSE